MACNLPCLQCGKCQTAANSLQVLLLTFVAHFSRKYACECICSLLLIDVLHLDELHFTFSLGDKPVPAVQVMSYGASAEAAAVTAIFTKMLQHSLKNSRGLSQHPAAVGLTKFSCMLRIALFMFCKFLLSEVISQLKHMPKSVVFVLLLCAILQQFRLLRCLT